MWAALTFEDVPHVMGEAYVERAVKEVSEAPTDPKDAVIPATKFYYDQQWHDAQIYDREKLGAGTVVTGPAIVSEMDSTTLILPGHAATVDKVGNLLINPV